MHWFTALILGIIQGITEFLPVSSKSHLMIGNAFFGLTNPDVNMAFDVMLHFASLLAIIVIFFTEIWDIIVRLQTRVILWIIIGTIPAGIVGLVFKKTITDFFSPERLYLVGIGLMLNGVILLIAGYSGWGARPVRDEGVRLRRNGRTSFVFISNGARLPLEKAGFKNSLIIGLAQAFALIPGISRSGTTISSGLVCGLEKRDAVKFSFLLAIPVILGANLLELKDFSKVTASVEPIPIIVGVVSCFLVSLVSIKLLIRLVQKSRLYYFSIYCFIVGALVLILKVFRVV